MQLLTTERVGSIPAKLNASPATTSWEAFIKLAPDLVFISFTNGTAHAGSPSVESPCYSERVGWQDNPDTATAASQAAVSRVCRLSHQLRRTAASRTQPALKPRLPQQKYSANGVFLTQTHS